MKTLFLKKLLSARRISCISRQKYGRFLHTKTHFARHLRNSIDLYTTTSIHGKIFKSGLLSDTFTSNNLINNYVKLQRLTNAHKLFDEMSQPNVVSWTSLVNGYVETGQPCISLYLFENMCGSPVQPNEFTYATVIKACSVAAELETGKKVHARVEISGFGDNLVVCSALIDMYGKCNNVDSARYVFNRMGYNKNIVSWTSMITTYVQNAQGKEALEIFRKFNSLMRERPNQFMLGSVISACASLGRLQLGKITHGAVIRGCCESNDVVSSALVDMYAKCGCISYSKKVFQRIQNPSIIPYTSMIVAAAKYGCAKLSFRLFDEMICRGINPNDVTFLGILHACSHSGLVDEGTRYLNSMHKMYGVAPDAKHYTCFVDMLSRAGRVEEAYELAKSIDVMPEEGALLWGSLLSASRLQGRADIAAEASKMLIQSNQQVTGAYVELSNTYTIAGAWDRAQSLRTEMKCGGIYKEPGCSWIEVKDSTHMFYAGDLSFEGASEILSLLRELEMRMKEKGYARDTVGLVFVDVEEEAREEIVSLHSERLALVFGLIHLPKSATMRIMKNLRMCRDCHEAFKLISEIVGREFVVRDLNRFHHFCNGLCTCNDFW